MSRPVLLRRSDRRQRRFRTDARGEPLPLGDSPVRRPSPLSTTPLGATSNSRGSGCRRGLPEGAARHGSDSQVDRAHTLVTVIAFDSRSRATLTQSSSTCPRPSLSTGTISEPINQAGSEVGRVCSACCWISSRTDSRGGGDGTVNCRGARGADRSPTHLRDDVKSALHRQWDAKYTWHPTRHHAR